MTIAYGYTANHKFWDEIGRIAPNVEYSESHRPHFEAMPAPWLPTLRYDEEKKSYFVVSVGKVVAYDHAGCIVPAGYRKLWLSLAGDTTTACLTYTATDYANHVIDLTTGVAYATNGTTTYHEDDLTTALQARGLIHPTERAGDFISKPIGIASYNYYKAAGTDWYNPANLYEHNFRPQALVAITCDYVATYPVFPALATTETTATAIANGASDLLHYFDGTHTRAAATGWFGSTAIHGVTRYADAVAAGDNVVGYMCANYPLAHDTTETPWAASVAGLVRQVDVITDISAAGDYFVDYDAGIVFFYEADGNAIPSPWSVSTTLTYYHYMAEGSATNTLSTYACATGDLEYGDFLTYDDHSNLIKATLDIAAAEGYASGTAYTTDPDYSASADADISAQLEAAISNYATGIVGQVIGVQNYPRDYLDRVKTAYEGNSDVTYRTPGSATGGRSNQLTYSGSAERMVIVNLILR